MERLLVAVAGCLHGHDVVNRIGATFPGWRREGLRHADAEVSHMDVTAACRVLGGMFPEYKFVDTLPYTDNMQAIHTAAVRFCEGESKFILASRVQPYSSVELAGDAGTLVPTVIDLLQSGLYELVSLTTNRKGESHAEL